jgi:hypothetical protein
LPEVNTIDLAAGLDHGEWTGYQKRALLIAALLIIFDTFPAFLMAETPDEVRFGDASLPARLRYHTNDFLFSSDLNAQATRDPGTIFLLRPACAGIPLAHRRR